MPDLGFMSESHLEEYIESRLYEAMQEGIMEQSQTLENPLLSREVRDILKNMYVLGFKKATVTFSNIMDDIDKVNGGN